MDRDAELIGCGKLRAWLAHLRTNYEKQHLVNYGSYVRLYGRLGIRAKE